MTPEAKTIAAAEELGIRRPTGDTCYGPKWLEAWIGSLPDFSTDANASILLIEHLAGKGFRFIAELVPSYEWEVVFYKDERGKEEDWTHASTFPLAVLNAFLLATGRMEK